MTDIVAELLSMRSCTVCEGDGTKSNGKQCGGCGGSGEVLRYGRIGKEAAAEIEHLRLSLSEARATGRREGLSEAAKIIDEGFDRGIKAKYLTCAHGRTGWEDCDQCAAAAIRAAMEKET